MFQNKHIHSDKKYNLNGRVCIENSCLFGLASLGVIYIFQPLINNLIPHTNKSLLIITIIISIIIITDLITSLKVVSSFKNTIKSIELKDSTQEFTKLVKETLNKNKKYLQKRLYNSFPDIDLSKIRNLKNEIKEDLKELIKK